MVSKNPVLRNITDYLIEEASAEEEELLGQASETEENDDKDQAMIKVNTRLFLPQFGFYCTIEISHDMVLQILL